MRFSNFFEPGVRSTTHQASRTTPEAVYKPMYCCSRPSRRQVHSQTQKLDVSTRRLVRCASVKCSRRRWQQISEFLTVEVCVIHSASYRLHGALTSLAATSKQSAKFLANCEHNYGVWKMQEYKSSWVQPTHTVYIKKAVRDTLQSRTDMSSARPENDGKE